MIRSSSARQEYVCWCHICVHDHDHYSEFGSTSIISTTALQKLSTFGIEHGQKLDEFMMVLATMMHQVYLCWCRMSRSSSVHLLS
jgi:hypothetical protein